MKIQTIEYKAGALRGLSGSVDVIGVMDSTGQNGVATFLDTPNDCKNREICWRDRFPTITPRIRDESVEVKLPECSDSNQVLRLISKIENSLRENNSYGSIMHTQYSLDGGVTIGIFMTPSKVGNLVMKLANMAEVERVEENQCSSVSRPIFLNQYKNTPISNVGPSRSIRVIIKGSELAGQRNAALWN